MRLPGTGEGRDWFPCDDAVLPIVARRRIPRWRRLFSKLTCKLGQIGRAHV